MAFAEHQLRLLSGKLAGSAVRTRELFGKTVSYIEGWYAIAEANRVFGFDAWDRETLAADCVWQDGRNATKLCAYTARVRIRVRAGDTVVQRDGSGFGQGSGTTLGEAHESALKEAETDATKRALITFGNLFGLALYDREQAGVKRTPMRRTPIKGAHSEAGLVWQILNAHGEEAGRHLSVEHYCGALKALIAETTNESELRAIWKHNRPSVEQLRIAVPELRTAKGNHYIDVLKKRYESRLQQVSETATTQRAPNSETAPAVEETPGQIDKSALLIAAPKRIRDDDHLRFVAQQPCLVCGRSPAQAHHLRFAQLRSMASKVSDEWTVPLCVLHHRALHDVGDEQAWWKQQHLDPVAEATRLWKQTHSTGVSASNDADQIDMRKPELL